jgi:putative oxidoreductase
VKRPLPTPVGDVALLATRVLLGVIMLAHGFQKLVVNGIGQTTAGFESMSIPLAIVTASFVTVVELVGGTLLILGLLTTVVAGLMGFVMAGAAAFVHARHGVFVGAGGWELVGSIAGALLALAVAGPGRLSFAHMVQVRARRAPTPAIPPPAPAPAPAWEEAIPPPGLPQTPLIRLAPQPGRWRPAPPVFVEPERSGPAHRPPAPVRHQ